MKITADSKQLDDGLADGLEALIASTSFRDVAVGAVVRAGLEETIPVSSAEMYVGWILQGLAKELRKGG